LYLMQILSKWPFSIWIMILTALMTP
jgi:hypothetical protein